MATSSSIDEHIRQYGWHCLHVFPTDDVHTQFTYSIGFAQSFDGPEVLVFGLSREKAHALINECATVLRSGERISAGVKDDRILAGDYKVMFRPVKPEFFNEYLGTATRHYSGKSFNAVVMFLPDSQHRFPWDHGYNDIDASESLSIV
jgi:hypothetical protein